MVLGFGRNIVGGWRSGVGKSDVCRPHPLPIAIGTLRRRGEQLHLAVFDCFNIVFEANIIVIFWE